LVDLITATAGTPASSSDSSADSRLTIATGRKGRPRDDPTAQGGRVPDPVGVHAPIILPQMQGGNRLSLRMSRIMYLLAWHVRL
jgi:hypothetical protein